jgi:hypothetical protein
MVAKIATGAIEDNPTRDGGKNAAAVALRRMGGKARPLTMVGPKSQVKATSDQASRMDIERDTAIAEISNRIRPRCPSDEAASADQAAEFRVLR